MALEPWVQTVAYCEQDRYAQAVLLSRMRSGELETAPIWDDVRTLRAGALPGIDIIFGGFPCQDISVAGNGKGLAGERSGLFFEIMRLADELRPRWIFLENVPGIRTRGLDVVIKELTALGYDCRWTVVSAAEVGAPHLRKRWFLLAHAHSAGVRDGSEWMSGGRQRELQTKGEAIPEHDGAQEFMADSNGLRKSQLSESGNRSGDWALNGSKIMADAESERLEGLRGCGIEVSSVSAGSEISRRYCEGREWWSSEPQVGRVVNGLPDRVAQIRCLGNSVVPLQVQTAFKRLAGLE